MRDVQSVFQTANRLGFDISEGPPASPLLSTNIGKARQWHDQALASLAAGRPKTTVQYVFKAMQHLHNWAAPLQTLGTAYVHLGEFEAAIDALKTCIELDERYDTAYSSLAGVYGILGDYDKMLKTHYELENAVAGLAENRFAIGAEHLRRGNYEVAASWLDKGLSSPTPAPKDVLRMLPYGVVSYPRLLHDIGQLNYLMEQKILDGSYYPVLSAMKYTISNLFDHEPVEDWTKVPLKILEPDVLTIINRFYRRVCHLKRAEQIQGAVLNPEHNYKQLQEKYLASQPNFMVVDDLLTDEALETLLNYCLESTIWHNDAQKGRNYLGAYRQTGILCPLVAQIADELRDRFATILADHVLSDLWAYRLVVAQGALGAHADSAAININLWLTSDQANKDPSSGGLILYDRTAPESWQYEAYNNDSDRIERYLEGANFYCIPYRQNRAIIFNSEIFHASDKVDFRDNFVNGRINMTFLFGARG